MEKTNDIITLVGVVMPVEWNDKGGPLEFAVFTYEEQEFLIDPESLCGKELAGLLQQKVRVAGTPGKTVNNRRTIRVTQYELLSSPDSASTPTVR